MKSIICSLIIFSFLTIPVNSNGQTKSKKERKLEQFNQTSEIVNNKKFRFIANRAFPMRGRSIDLTTNYGFIEIKEDKATGDLPYFGRAYSAPYGERGGIRFDNTIENENVEINEKKMRISYRFEVSGEHDRYTINMDIYYDGNSSVSISSNNKSHISYNGDIQIPEEDKN